MIEVFISMMGVRFIPSYYRKVEIRSGMLEKVRLPKPLKSIRIETTGKIKVIIDNGYSVYLTPEDIIDEDDVKVKEITIVADENTIVEVSGYYD